MPIISVDLYPTLLELADLEPPEGQPLDGLSVLPVLTGQAESLDRKALYWHFPGYLGASGDQWRTTPAGAIRAGDLKLIQFFEDDHIELYDLDADIGQGHDLADERPEDARRLLSMLERWREQDQCPIADAATARPAEAGQARRVRVDPAKNQQKRQRAEDRGKSYPDQIRQPDPHRRDPRTLDPRIDGICPLPSALCLGLLPGSTLSRRVSLVPPAAHGEGAKRASRSSGSFEGALEFRSAVFGGAGEDGEVRQDADLGPMVDVAAEDQEAAFGRRSAMISTRASPRAPQVKCGRPVVVGDPPLERRGVAKRRDVGWRRSPLVADRRPRGDGRGGQ